MSKVFVGMSGGVDSSVSAALLKRQGHDVTGVFMKNWSKNLPGFNCPWLRDYQDAKRVAVKLGVRLELYDFEDQYFDKVVQYMIDEYSAGRTPNPDIKCNEEIKFKLFQDVCVENGAEMIATGHYARIDHQNNQLLRAKDQNKDQTYFLYRMSSDSVSKIIFPVGEMLKTEVRGMAGELGLSTAQKKDSTGVCFIGDVGIRDFLKQYVEYEDGPIKDEDGNVIGTHEGAIFYTIGQRHGLRTASSLPVYVTGKDMGTNTVFVSSNIANPQLWHSEVGLRQCHWINDLPSSDSSLEIRTRHLGPLLPANIKVHGDDISIAKVRFDEPVKAVSPGQSFVVYCGETCLGGGIVS